MIKSDKSIFVMLWSIKMNVLNLINIVIGKWYIIVNIPLLYLLIVKSIFYVNRNLSFIYLNHARFYMTKKLKTVIKHFYTNITCGRLSLNYVNINLYIYWQATNRYNSRNYVSIIKKNNNFIRTVYYEISCNKELPKLPLCKILAF